MNFDSIPNWIMAASGVFAAYVTWLSYRAKHRAAPPIPEPKSEPFIPEIEHESKSEQSRLGISNGAVGSQPAHIEPSMPAQVPSVQKCLKVKKRSILRTYFETIVGAFLGAFILAFIWSSSGSIGMDSKDPIYGAIKSVGVFAIIGILGICIGALEKNVIKLYIIIILTSSACGGAIGGVGLKPVECAIIGAIIGAIVFGIGCYKEL